jgi:hypothetical protein
MRSLLALAVFGCSAHNAAMPDAPPPPADTPGGARTHTLYLNFGDPAMHGVTLAPGSADDATQNISSLVTTPTTLAPYLGSADDRATQINNLVAEITNILAPYDIQVVTSAPSSGTFMMIVSTDTPSSALSCDDCPALAPGDCGGIDSPIAFNFGSGSGSALPVHGFTADTVAMAGLSILGIPTSAVPDDCMCFSDANCAFPPDRQCSIGGEGTAISQTKPGCPTSWTVMNESALFLAGFGPAQ